jgi:hypothetical protein
MMPLLVISALRIPRSIAETVTPSLRASLSIAPSRSGSRVTLMLILRAFVLASTAPHLSRKRECLLRMGTAPPSRSPIMIASTGKPGTGEGTNVVVVLAVVVLELKLELVVDELVELPVLVEVEPDVAVLDVEVDELVVELEVVLVVELVVLEVSMSIEWPQCTSVPCHPAAQPSSEAMKLAL